MIRFAELPYQDLTTSHRLFEHIHQQPMAILLDSSCARTQDKSHYSRFDIFSAFPSKIVSIEPSQQPLKAGSNTTKSKPSIAINDAASSNNIDISQLSQWLEALKPKNELPDPIKHVPFCGGLLGYWSYNLNQITDDIQPYQNDALELPLMKLGVYDWAVICDHAQQKAWLIEFKQPSTGDFERPTFEDLQNQFESILANSEQRKASSQSFEILGDWQANMTQASYNERFAQVHEYIHAGDCYQINLAQRFTNQYSGTPWAVYQALAAANKAPFSAYVNLGSQQIISISPERFLQVQDKFVVTEPIKGTQPRSPEPQQDEINKQTLANSEKDRAENLMIVDLMRNDLGRCATPGSVKVPELFKISSFSAVHHLVSKVTATLRVDVSNFDCLISAFPGGSITGAPKRRAMEIIRELEPDSRHVYCGSIGYIDYQDNMDTSIAIRTLVSQQTGTNQHQLYCWAGGGLVADSQPDSEYQECFDKLKKILPVLAPKKQ